MQPTIEEPAALASVVLVNDPATYRQLLRGFYELEVNSWRWAAPRFDVVLGVPPDAPKKGAVLFLKFTLPEQSIATLKSITITGRVARTELPPETYTEPGPHEYRREVPGALFTKDVVDAGFTVDKSFIPAGDDRNVAVITNAIGLESK